MFDLVLTGKNARKACFQLNTLSKDKIDGTLVRIANEIRNKREFLKDENSKDVINATKKGLSAGFIDRLLLTDNVINGIADGIFEVAKLNSPVGKKIYSYNNEYQGIDIEKINVPFGVIGIIFESRPNVAADAFALCFKTQNAVILRGGSDAFYSTKAIVDVIKFALKENGIDENAVSIVEDTSHETAEKFMKLDKYVDLLIPRGGARLIDTVKAKSTIPVIETGKGNCHIFVDKYADIDKAVRIILNAKTQRLSVCNALESLMIHSEIVEKALPLIAEKLIEKGIELRLDDRAIKVLNGCDKVVPATEEDFYTEYDDAVLSVETVDSIEKAIEKINERSSHHSESIITENKENAEKFICGVDSACVYHNASTRFSDGFVFGLGAEIGISTQKLHARGPMGLDALVTTKYIVKGDGAVRK